MIFVDARFDAFSERVRRQLAIWFKGYSVLDVACGYGRFSDGFEDYHGVDFCEGMIELAKEKYPQRADRFQLVPDAATFQPGRTYDVVFEVNSCKSLGMNSGQFFDTFGQFATKYVVTLECDDFVIRHKYADKKSW
jgi:SAM-dependent methyltransferase